MNYKTPLLCMLFASLIALAACATDTGPGSSNTNPDAGADLTPQDPDAAPPNPNPTPDAGTPPVDPPNPNPTPDAGTPPVDPPTTPDAGTPPPVSGVAPGGLCNCDADCQVVEGYAGVCVFGICMNQASGPCSAAGSTVECNSGAGCWGLQGEDGYFCWPDCNAYTCEGTCDADNSCVPTATSDCDNTCAEHCSQSTTDPPVDPPPPIDPPSGGPGIGPGPDCPNLPARDCVGSAAYCGELLQFNPSTTAYYDDYPINGESASNQYRSWLRRDLMMLLDFATAKVACKAASWNTGNGGPLGFGDMSEQTGDIPGTSINQPGHPANTHENGYDIDLGYYQLGQANNRLRPICEHTINGADQNHCVSAPDILDVWRTALFLGYIFESPRTRVVGADGQAGPLLLDALSTLCSDGWLSSDACADPPLAYETTNMNYGWYYFHHHHLHISLSQANIAPTSNGPMQCMVPGCNGMPLKANPRWNMEVGF